ncbi:hypothetical protein ACEPAI_5550 [Sanghuangporus weigelae]
MGRYNSYPEFTAPSQPLESVLRAGQVRIRPYKSGSVKHAHIVLKKVGDEVYEDSKGRRRTRGVYSFFASKVINCKPGKEIFFAIDDYLEERVVTFEADLHHPDDADNDVLTSAKSEETLVHHESQSRSLPPKMRKMWARKEMVAVKQDTPHHAIQKKTTVGVQASPMSESVSVQTSPTSRTNVSGTERPFSLLSAGEDHLLSSSVESQIEAIRLEDTSSDSLPTVLDAYPVKGSEVRCSPSPELVSSVMNDIGTKFDLPPETDSRNSRERSLSPMELESVSSSPQNSPRISMPLLPDVKSKMDDHALELQPEVPGELRCELPAMLAESVPIDVKKEPEEIALPPPPKPKLVSRSFRAPIFVPARHKPFYSDTDVQDNVPLHPPALSETPITAHTGVAVRQHDKREDEIRPPKPASPATNSTFPPSPTYSPRMVNTEFPLFSAAMQSSSGSGRGSTHPLPAFVPETQLSRSLAVPSSQYQVQCTSREGEADATLESCGSRSDSPNEISAEWTDSITRKRKRMDGINEPVNPIESRAGSIGLPIKKWKSVVKQEPSSPVLSAVPLSMSDSNEHSKSNTPYPPALSVSIPNFTQTLVSPSSSQPFSGQMSTPTTLKAEHMDLNSLNFDSSMIRPDPTASFHRAPRPYIDLTISSRSYQNTAHASAPVKRFNRTRRRVAGVCSSLPVIKTAQIKMDSSSRDTIGVRAIVFDPAGDRFAVICRDNTVRIWDNTFQEIAKLAHSAPVISIAWMVDDISIASLGSNGIVSRWSLVGKNKWMWEMLADCGDTDPSCFAYYRQNFAVASPRRGVRIWECQNGLWMPMQCELLRKDTLTMRFINNGNELLCGCSDGSLIRYSISTCSVQQVMAFKTKVFHVDADPANSHALVAQALGSAHLVDFALGNLRPFDRVLQDYSLRDAEQQYGARGVHGFKPIFTDYGDAVIFGAIEGRVLVWDRRRGQIIYEMDHGSDVHVQAVASFNSDNGDQHLVSCTKYGLLTWWRLPIRIF